MNAELRSDWRKSLVVSAAYAATIAATLFVTAPPAHAELVQCGGPVCASPFSISVDGNMMGGGNLTYDAETGQISLDTSSLTGMNAVSTGPNSAMWMLGDGTQMMVNNLAGNSDPILIFGVGASTGSVAHAFSFAFSVPVALSGTIAADSSLGYSLTSPTGVGTIAPLFGGSVLIATDSDIDGVFAAIDKGVNVGGAFSRALTDPATVTNSYSATNTFFDPNLADYELMSVLLAFTLTPNTGIGLSGHVQQVVVPLPAALPLLLSGIAGFGFATRRGRRAVTSLA